jgi:hypothetical protein
VQLPEITVYETAPVPLPPEVVRVSGSPYVPFDEETVKGNWSAFNMEIVLLSLVAAEYESSLDLVADTTQSPALVLESTSPETVQLPEITVYETAPVPLPPEVVRVSGSPYVPFDEETVKGNWSAFSGG